MKDTTLWYYNVIACYNTMIMDHVFSKHELVHVVPEKFYIVLAIPPKLASMNLAAGDLD